jgi:hypothetical protein
MIVTTLIQLLAYKHLIPTVTAKRMMLIQMMTTMAVQMMSIPMMQMTQYVVT